jgi:hypothetical protein
MAIDFLAAKRKKDRLLFFFFPFLLGNSKFASRCLGRITKSKAKGKNKSTLLTL